MEGQTRPPLQQQRAAAPDASAGMAASSSLAAMAAALAHESGTLIASSNEWAAATQRLEAWAASEHRSNSAPLADWSPEVLRRVVASLLPPAAAVPGGDKDAPSSAAPPPAIVSPGGRRLAAALVAAADAAASRAATALDAPPPAAALADARLHFFWGCMLLTRLAEWQHGGAGDTGKPGPTAAAKAVAPAWLPNAATALGALTKAACGGGGGAVHLIGTRRLDMAAADRLLTSAALALHRLAAQWGPRGGMEGAVRGALARHLRFLVAEAATGRAAPEALTSEACALLLGPNSGNGDAMLQVLAGAVVVMLEPPAPQAVVPAVERTDATAARSRASCLADDDSGLKALSTLAARAVAELGGKGASAEAAAAALVRLLTAIAQRPPAETNVAAPLLNVLHGPLLAHPKAAVRRLLLDLATACAGAVAAAGAAGVMTGTTEAAAAAGVTLLARMAGDRDANVRARALALIASAAPAVLAAAATSSLAAGPVLAAGAEAEEDVERPAAQQQAAGGDGDGGHSSEGTSGNEETTAGDSSGSSSWRFEVESELLEALVPRLLDASKAVRRAALQALGALLPVPTVGSESSPAAGSGGVPFTATLMREALPALVVLSDAPPASPAHDAACQAAACELIACAPAALGFGAALKALLECDSDTGATALLCALLADGAQTGSGNAAQTASKWQTAYAAWAGTLGSVQRPQMRRLQELCAPLVLEGSSSAQRQGVAAGNTAGPTCSAARALEQLRRCAVEALATELGALAEDGAADAPAGPSEQVLQCVAAAARVWRVSGGTGGTAAVASMKQQQRQQAGEDAAGECAVLLDALGLCTRTLSAVGAGSAAQQAGHAASGGWALDGAAWLLEVAATAAEGPFGGRLAPLLRPPLLALMARGEMLSVPACCAVPALRALCACCAPSQLQQLLGQLEERLLQQQNCQQQEADENRQQQQEKDGWPKQQASTLVAYLTLLRLLAGRYAAVEAQFRAELAASRARGAAAGNRSDSQQGVVAPATQLGAAAAGNGQGGGGPQPGSRRGGAKGDKGGSTNNSSGGDGEALGVGLELEAQRRVDDEAAARYMDSLMAERAPPASRVALLRRLAEDAGVPGYARALALSALEELLPLSNSLAAATVPTAVLAPLRDPSAAPVARTAAARTAGAVAARWPGRAPEILSALEATVLQELRQAASSSATAAAAASGGNGGRFLTGASAEGGAPAQLLPCKEGPANLSALAATVSVYGRAVLVDGFVTSGPSLAALSACLSAGAAAPAVAAAAAAAARHLVAAAPAHAQRKLAVGLLTHAPAGGGAAAMVAEGTLSALLPEGLLVSEEMGLALVSALAAAVTSPGAANGPGASTLGAADQEEGGIKEGGNGASVAAAGGQRVEVTEACAALLEQSGAAPSARVLSALSALVLQGGTAARLTRAAAASLHAYASRVRAPRGAAARDRGAAAAEEPDKKGPPTAAAADTVMRQQGAAQQQHERLLQVLATAAAAAGGGAQQRGAGKRKRAGQAATGGGATGAAVYQGGGEIVAEYARALQVYLARQQGATGVRPGGQQGTAAAAAVGATGGDGAVGRGGSASNAVRAAAAPGHQQPARGAAVQQRFTRASSRRGRGQ